MKVLYFCEIRAKGNVESLFEALPEFWENFVITDKPGKKSFTVKFYCENKKESEKVLSSIKKNIPLLKRSGIKICSFAVKNILRENWTEKWRKYFKVRKIGKKIVIKPSWRQYKEKANDVVIEIDPGMSFGTGKHETTQFCLEEIEKARNTGCAQSFADAGCGSGILSIAAAKLGFAPVFAFDNDPESIETTRQNFSINKLSPNVAKFAILPLEKTRNIGTFDIVAANIISGVLLENTKTIKRLLSKNAYLILAGILDAESEKIIEAFEKEGLSFIRKKSSRGWTGMLFRV
jgi:ribosomal protein L11 methyltransferase